MNPLTNLEEKLDISFKNKELLEQAFVHRSYLNENTYPLGHNERLEFLGDAVLELITTEYLFLNFPDKNEGELTALRSALVKRETLKEVAEKLEFYKYLKLSKGESKTANNQIAILANTTESFIGALFLDAGIEKVRKFLEQYLFPKTKNILTTEAYIDAKSNLQEIIQEKEGLTPTYKVLKESGPDHNKTFEVAVYSKEKQLAKGKGNSKQAAETDAAANALKNIQ